jgi:DNA-binding NarL/FixJ family response regulator
MCLQSISTHYNTKIDLGAAEMFVKNENEKIIQIVMLDKEEKLLEVIKNYFSLKKIHIVVTNKSDVAWKELEKNLPDCLVIDIIMPNNEGYNFIKNLKKSKDFQHIPFILLTTKGLTEDRILGYKLGCSAYISKPFDPEELEFIIKNIVLKNDLFLESILENYMLIKEIKLNLIKKYSESIKNKLQFSLTTQEHYVLNQILLGDYTNNIALNLKVSKRNVEKYISRLLDKTQTQNIQDLKSLYWYTKKNNYRANDGNRTRE